MTEKLLRIPLVTKFSLIAAVLSCGTALAPAGGTPENMLLIIDPANVESMYVGNYYKDARNIPDCNVIYMDPGATNYTTLVDVNLDALFGSLTAAAIDDHIDYIVLMPGAPYDVYAPGLISDGCYTVSRFSISSAYTMAFIADEVLGGLPSTTSNRYYSTSHDARAFDSETTWLSGAPSSSGAARSYFIGAMLGYSGQRGNTIDETLDMIDRAVAADGTRPAGTFYFMDNTADPARNVRSPQFAAVASAITAFGGAANINRAVLPTGQHDVLGIMTGAASPAIDSTDMTLVPGAFCDHLTSYAARFNTSAQTKLSRWIAKGAAGSWGAVEEPCNYTGKFPHARLHRYYLEGASLGEAALRSAQYVPFQMLLYGDPMTRPFAYLPDVSVDNLPSEPVGGLVVVTLSATTTHPSAAIDGLDVLVDGVLYAELTPGQPLLLDTTDLSDGWHELRVLAYDDTLVKSTGRWVGEFTVDNHGQSVAITPSAVSGDWNSAFDFDITAIGGQPNEVRVVRNGHVAAAAPGTTATLTVHGLTLGAGLVSVQAEALYNDGHVVRSAPVTVDVAFEGGAPSGTAPVAYGFIKSVSPDLPFLVELPATFDDSDTTLTYEILSAPTTATVTGGQTGPYRLMHPLPGASGSDTFTYRVTSTVGDSNVATVTLVYDWQLPGDLDCDGDVDFDDIDPFVLALSGQAGYEAEYPDCNWMNADINNDGYVDFDDIDPFVALLAG